MFRHPKLGSLSPVGCLRQVHHFPFLIRMTLKIDCDPQFLLLFFRSPTQIVLWVLMFSVSSRCYTTGMSLHFSFFLLAPSVTLFMIGQRPKRLTVKFSFMRIQTNSGASFKIHPSQAVRVLLRPVFYGSFLHFFVLRSLLINLAKPLQE